MITNRVDWLIRMNFVPLTNIHSNTNHILYFILYTCFFPFFQLTRYSLEEARVIAVYSQR